MKRFIQPLVIAIALAAGWLALTQQVHAQVTASSYSTGGTAIATASGRGNTRLNSSAYATGGGYARSNITGRGTNGGFASGNSRAYSNGGVAISNGRSIADGWGARSHVDSTARTVGGFARSNGTAAALGNWSNAAARSGVRTWGTYGDSNATAIDNRRTVQPNVQPQTYGPASGGSIQSFGTMNRRGGGVTTGMIRTGVRAFGVRRGW